MQKKTIFKLGKRVVRKKISDVSKIFSFLLIMFLLTSYAQISNGEGSDDEPEINYLHIDAIIDNSYAITEVTQEFQNPYDHAIDTTFLFRIPLKAFISNLTITINEKTYYANIATKEEVEKKYQKAVSEGRDAALLEARGKNLFAYSVSISENQKFIISLRYEEYLEKTLGIYEYSLMPVAIDLTQKIKDFNTEVVINSASIISNLEVHNYKTTIEWVSSNKAIVKYNEKDALPKNEFLVEYQIKAPEVNGRMLDYSNGDENFFFHVFSPQKSDLVDKQLDKEIIFVLDKSGSMSGTKIQQLKSSFSQIINELPPNDSFGIILFDSTVTNYKDELIFANEENKNDANNYINEIEDGGSTNLNDALANSLTMIKNADEKVPIVVMLTDGKANAGEYTTPPSIRENIIEKNVDHASIFTLGFGYDVDFDFLKALSLENYGYAFRIYEGEDASEQITDFYSTISTPLLKDINFKYNNVEEVYPTHVDHLFEGSEIVVTGKYYDTNSLISNVSAYSRDGSRNFKSEFQLNKTDNNSFIPRFWAYSKINSLLDQIAVNGEDEQTISLIVELALEYEFATPYTSFIVEVEEENKEIENEEQKSDNDANNAGSMQNPPGDTKGYSDSYESGDDDGSTPNVGILALVPIVIIAVLKRRKKKFLQN